MTLVKVNNSIPQRPFVNMVDEFFNEFPLFGKNLGLEYSNFPPVNIHETPDAYHLELNVPGRSKEDFKISVEGGLLTISYEKKEESKSDDYKTVRREFSYRGFKRSFSIDQQVDADKIQAKYENGLLKLLLPKKAETKENTKQINVD
jgi:HSP20 family protein